MSNICLWWFNIARKRRRICTLCRWPVALTSSGLLRALDMCQSDRKTKYIHAKHHIQPHAAHHTLTYRREHIYWFFLGTFSLISIGEIEVMRGVHTPSALHSYDPEKSPVCSFWGSVRDDAIAKFSHESFAMAQIKPHPKSDHSGLRRPKLHIHTIYVRRRLYWYRFTFGKANWVATPAKMSVRS